MKKLTLLGTLLFASSVAMAGFQQNVGNVIPVSQALSAADKSVVVIEGSIVKQVDDDKFIFADNTGSMKVEIEDHVWRGLNVTPQDKLRLIGISDKDFGRNAKLEVTEVQKIQ
ncbi:NirD/YgiW/YdeI family stress tolerance protein [Caviibacterium pharyngocola]|uniref:Uncharacterized protein n=1 Tax=Caviibacterium pharyngocola TaxID=28159 RepID=A0A2M8RT62_9PAST|nr:NirD/YgiW/YdeI family stress tolerance protein [Caviibacterium pharyngocola]PJG82085.1 hypothetical protein CVP04_10985 [Caviibacterium pharyngocola]